VPVASDRISGLRIVGWSLRILAMLFVALFAYGIVISLPDMDQGTSVTVPLLQQSILLLVGAVIVGWGSAHAFDQAKKADQELNDRLVGYVSASEQVRIDALAGWMRLTEKETADRLAKMASTGKLSNFRIDLENRVISKAPPPPPRPVSPPSQPVVQPHVPPPPPPMGESDEIIRIKAKLYELEQLKQGGKISDSAYTKLKEEYEKKMSQADKGTQVY
jgi:hypothetical protein